jgi:hypothetical protein
VFVPTQTVPAIEAEVCVSRCSVTPGAVFNLSVKLRHLVLSLHETSAEGCRHERPRSFHFSVLYRCVNALVPCAKAMARD